MTQCEVTNFDNQNQMDKMMNGGILYGTIFVFQKICLNIFS